MREHDHVEHKVGTRTSRVRVTGRLSMLIEPDPNESKFPRYESGESISQT